MRDTAKVAWVFPGQGSQAVGMGKDLYSNFRAAKSVFDEADDALEFSLSKLCFEGPDTELVKTINVQPAVLTVSIAFLRAAQEAASDLPAPNFVAGHSLGQYTALVASGALTLADAVKLVRERGRLMHEASQAQPGGMMAVIGADSSLVEEICAAAGIQISNVNSPGQVVVSGASSGLAEFKKQAELKGIRRIIPLKVSGAFHSRLMEPAVQGLKTAIERHAFLQPPVPLISNTTGAILYTTVELKKELVDQLTNCVQWQSTVEKMIANGVASFYEIGQGQVLSGLIKRINPDVQVTHAAELTKTAS